MKVKFDPRLKVSTLVVPIAYLTQPTRDALYDKNSPLRRSVSVSPLGEAAGEGFLLPVCDEHYLPRIAQMGHPELAKIMAAADMGGFRLLKVCHYTSLKLPAELELNTYP